MTDRSDPLDAQIAALVPAYLASRREDLVTVRDQLASGDFEAIRGLGHRLKGSGRTYGLGEISTLGRKLEEAAAQEDAAAVGHVVERLETFLQTLDED